MISAEIKQTIQTAYSQFLQSRGLKARYGQKLMIAEIARTLAGVELNEDHLRTSDNHVCVIEAGTGTGKTVAYLLAAIPIAQLLGKKLIVSTATVALQEQIILKDLPELKQHSGLEFSYNLAKGRGRYLCLSKLDRILSDQQGFGDSNRALYEDEQPAIDADAMTLYQTMMTALASGDWDGDKDDWKDELDDRLWFRVTTDHRQCTGRRCSNIASCSFFKARDSLSSVDVVVTNHDLVMADLSLGGGAILPAPADAIYIFDEGHHLPDKALNHFANHLRVISTTRWLDQSLKSIPVLQEDLDAASDVVFMLQKLPQKLESAKQLMEQLWPLLQALAGDLADSQERKPRYRFEKGVVPEDLQQLALALKQSFNEVFIQFDKISMELQDLLEDRHSPIPKVDLENWAPVLGAWAARAQACLNLWASYAQPDAANTMPKARWLTLIDTGAYVDIEICSSPILAANNLTVSLWNECCAAVVTSATLSALGHFERFRMRAGTPETANYALVPSPFDFQKAQLRVPKNAADAGNALAHTESIIAQLTDIIDPNQGSLVLFSSRKQMLDVYEALPVRLKNKILLKFSYKASAPNKKPFASTSSPSTTIAVVCCLAWPALPRGWIYPATTAAM